MVIMAPALRQFLDQDLEWLALQIDAGTVSIRAMKPHG